MALPEELDRAARRRLEFLMGIDADLANDGRGDVIRRARVGGRGFPLGVGAAMHVAALEAAASSWPRLG
jgi:hypothetical protein